MCALSVGALFEPEGGQLLIEKSHKGNCAQETCRVGCKKVVRLIDANEVKDP